MVNIGDTVHVYNEEFGADYQAVVLDVFDDGTSQVQHYMHLTPRLRRHNRISYKVAAPVKPTVGRFLANGENKK